MSIFGDLIKEDVAGHFFHENLYSYELWGYRETIGVSIMLLFTKIFALERAQVDGL